MFSRIWAIYLKELRCAFCTPVAYLVGTIFLVWVSCWFYWTLCIYNQPLAPAGQPLQMVFGELLVFFLMVALPILTMRLLSEEQAHGTLETMATAPVRWSDILLGKYAGVMTVYLAFLLPTLSFVVALRWFIPGGDQIHSALDWATVASTYLGLILIGSTFLSVGIFTSSLTKSQVGAALLGILFLFGLASAILLEQIPAYRVAREKGLVDYSSFFYYVDLFQQMRDFASGIVDSNRIAYHASLTAGFLFLSREALKARFE